MSTGPFDPRTARVVAVMGGVLPNHLWGVPEVYKPLPVAVCTRHPAGEVPPGAERPLQYARLMCDLMVGTADELAEDMRGKIRTAVATLVEGVNGDEAAHDRFARGQQRLDALVRAAAPAHRPALFFEGRLGDLLVEQVLGGLPDFRSEGGRPTPAMARDLAARLVAWADEREGVAQAAPVVVDVHQALSDAIIRDGG